MKKPAAPPKKRRFRWMRAFILLLGSVAGLAIYLNSDSFRETVRARVVAELERMTGGKVEIQSFSWNLSHLHFEARELTIHGLEGLGETPYVHADRVAVQLKIVSLLSRKIALREVAIDRLTVHLIVGPDGVTNQPLPKTGQSGLGLSTQRLFDLAVNRVEVNGGTLILNQERIPFAVAGDQFSASMSYSRQDKGYDGNISVSLRSARWRDRAPVNGEVDLHVLLRATEGEIKSLKVSTGHSTLQASGTVRSYNHPEIQLQYVASLDLPEVARQARVSEVRAGRADLKGTFTFRGGRYSSQGDVAIRGLEWQDTSLSRPWHASGIDVSSSFSLSPEKIDLPRLTVRIFGGSVQGESQVTNWNASTTPGKSPPKRGTARLQLSRLQIGQVAAAISTARLPLNKIDLAGSASGEIKSSWSGPLENAVAEINLDVDPPANPSPREVPVTAHLRTTYHGDIRTLDIASLSLATRAIHANATGELGSRRAQARLAVNATDLHELQPALDALRPGTRIPVSMGGHAAFNGVIFGDLDALSARGRVELADFVTEIGLPQQVRAAAPHSAGPNSVPLTHWDSLVADLSYSPSSLSLQRGMLRRGKTQTGFSATVSLRQGVFDEYTSQFTVDLRVDNADVADVQALVGMNYPVTGVVSGDAHASGTAHNLRGSGNLQIAKLTVYGEPFRDFRSQVRLVGKEVQLSNITLAHNGAQLTGSFAYDLGGRSFRFDLTGANIELASLHGWQLPRFTMEGKAGFHVTGLGGAGAPVINGRLDIASLMLNHETVGRVSVVGETHGANLVVRGQSFFEDATLNLAGSVQLVNDFPGQMTLQFAHLDFDPLIRGYLQGQITGHSSMAGSIEVHGPMKKPRDLNVTGSLSQLSADIEGIKVQNDGPIHFSMDREVVRADQFHLIGKDTDLYMHGSMQLAGDHELDLHAKGRLDLKLAQGFNPNILAYGPATFTVDVAGSLAHPQTSGRIELADAGVSLVDLPNGLSHIKGTMVFAQDHIQIEKLTAQSGGGELSLGGFLAYRNGFYFDLTATGKDVRLRYPPGISSSADASLRYTGSAKSSLLSGDIIVTRFGMNPRFDFGPFLAQTKNTPSLSSLNPFLDNLRIDVHITSTPELRVETTLAKVSGDLDLRVRGTAARPAVLGRVNIAEGDVSFNGTKYRLERGDITFSNPLTIEPVVNIEMSARVQNYDITIGLHGTMASGKGLSMTYRSDPPLANADIIALLAFGRTRGQELYHAAQPGQNTSDPTTASNAILGQALDAAVSDRVERLFGASRVKIDPQFIGAGNNPSARVTIEQQINNNVTLTYITSLTQSTETVVQLEYNVDKNVSIVAVRDQNGVLGFDVHVRRRKK
jgi:translocation and assembly module TamB